MGRGGVGLRRAMAPMVALGAWKHGSHGFSAWPQRDAVDEQRAWLQGSPLAERSLGRWAESLEPRAFKGQGGEHMDCKCGTD